MSYYWVALVLFTAQAFSIEGDRSASYQEKCISRRLINHYQLNKEIFGVGMCDGNNENEFRQKRRIVPTFQGNPRPRGELLASKFHVNSYNFEQTNSLVGLVNKIAQEYLNKCPPVIYYDSFVEKSDGLILENLFKVSSKEAFSALIHKNIAFKISN